MEIIVKILRIIFAIQLLNNINDTMVNIAYKIEYKEEPIMMLEIPKITFKGYIYNIDSKLNDIDKNIVIMNDSDMPDENNSLLIIGGHSGYGKYAYFNNLKKLEINDEVLLTYKNKKYRYKIINYYLDTKDGSIVVNNYKDKNIVILYTCYIDKKNYLVYVGEMI